MKYSKFSAIGKLPYFLLFMILFFSNCKKETMDTKLQSFRVTVYEEIYSASLLWDKVESTSGDPVQYSVIINDSIIENGLETCKYKINGLFENTSYTGMVIAFAGTTKIAEKAYTFTTLKNQPPHEFEMVELAIKSNSVLLRWEAAIDPEKSAVVYDISVNNSLKYSGLTECSYTVEDLQPGILYSATIAARDSVGKTTELEFSFRTISVSNSILVHQFIEYEKYKRDFAFYVPSGFDTATSVPLVINLHGANGNAWNEINSTYFKTIADRENFILLMPQALRGTFNGETLYQWNAHYIFPWDDLSFLNYLIDYLFTKYHIDLSRVYISGMSNGGFMTFFAARGLQERVAAIAPIAGLMSDNVFHDYTLSRPIPLCYMHGSADQVVPINGSVSVADVIGLWVANNNCSPEPIVTHLPDITTNDNSTVTLYQYYGYSPDSEIQYYSIEGGGHSVPGVEPGANMDINALEVIWSFFKRHSYPDHAEGRTVITD